MGRGGDRAPLRWGNLETVQRSGRGSRWLGLVLAAGLTTAGAVTEGPVVAAAGTPDQVPDVAGIRSAQQAVVELNHRVPLGEDQFAVNQVSAAVDSDRQALTAAQQSASSAATAAAGAAARLGTEQAALASATSALGEAQTRLASDRAAMRAIAIGLYTGQVATLQPTSLSELEADQQAVIGTDEVEVVAGIVEGDLGRDLAETDRDQRSQDRLAGLVRSDAQQARSAAADQASAASAASAAAADLSRDNAELAAARARLASAQAELVADLAAVNGPDPSSNGLSVLGSSALSAAELTAWYRQQGYVDMTPTPIQQLADWYLQAGSEEGIRGDVAFAQAVLETGGFSSPDAIGLNNYAGIGHCDTCSSGWAFPSAQTGVLGQEQLLRIFAAGGSPAGGPPPVLDALDPAHQGRRGCCSTWEALTGVWASDPTYGGQIMAIYQAILSFTTASAR